jgi:hypothetical protein
MYSSNIAEVQDLQNVFSCKNIMHLSLFVFPQPYVVHSFSYNLYSCMHMHIHTEMEISSSKVHLSDPLSVGYYQHTKQSSSYQAGDLFYKYYRGHLVFCLEDNRKISKTSAIYTVIAPKEIQNIFAMKA